MLSCLGEDKLRQCGELKQGSSCRVAGAMAVAAGAFDLAAAQACTCCKHFCVAVRAVVNSTMCCCVAGSGSVPADVLQEESRSRRASAVLPLCLSCWRGCPACLTSHI